MVFDKDEVWKKGKIVEGYNSSQYRKDDCDAWMKYDNYGDGRKSIYEWEVDHIDPNKGDNIDNLRPLQWENNVAKSDAKGGSWKCVVKSKDSKNIRL